LLIVLISIVVSYLVMYLLAAVPLPYWVICSGTSGRWWLYYWDFVLFRIGIL